MRQQHLKNDRDSLKTMIILFKAHQALTEYIKEDIKDSGFDLNEFGVFEVIYHKQKLQVHEIKEKVLVAPSSLTYILDKLQKKKLIRRERCETDGRVFFITLTDEGLKKGLEIFPKHYDNLKFIFNQLSDEESDLINSLLKKIGYKAEEQLLWNIYILIINLQIL